MNSLGGQGYANWEVLSCLMQALPVFHALHLHVYLIYPVTDLAFLAVTV